MTNWLATATLTCVWFLAICFTRWQRAGVELRIWLKQGEEKSLLARIVEILEEVRKRLSRQKVRKFSKKTVNLTKKIVNSPKKSA